VRALAEEQTGTAAAQATALLHLEDSLELPRPKQSIYKH
jgi:hypothetical protein